MKIQVKVYLQEQERLFTIPCGTGDKTIKWLGIVASQRFSNAAPNGILRRRDDFCGISETAQYQVENVILPSGKIAHPGRYINESDVKDGDTVIVRLSALLAVNAGNGSPSRTQWSTVAFSTSEVNENNELASFQSELEMEEASKEDFEFLNGLTAAEYSMRSKELMKRRRSNADFMRIVLESQMPDLKKAEYHVNSTWLSIDGCIPRLNMQDVDHIKFILTGNWDVLTEVFAEFATDGCMTEEQFLEFTSEAEFFSAYTSATQSAKIFSRTCSYTQLIDDTFRFEHAIVALLLIAQAKFNDTLESKLQPKTSFDALSKLFEHHILPLARRIQFKSILKIEFCSDDCLSLIRDMYDDLLNLFTKYAAKLRDVPTTVPVEDITEVLVLADLIADPGAFEKTQKFLQEVRRGTIIGSEIVKSSSAESSGDEASPEEFSFPEFVEVTARAGFVRYYDPDAAHSIGDDSDFTEQNSILQCLIRGVKAAIEGSNSSDEKPHGRGGKSPVPARGGARSNQVRK